MVFIWLYCQRSFFCALVTLEREEQEGPVDWVSWLWNAWVLAWMLHPHRGGGRACSCAGARYTRSGGFRAHLQWRGTPTWCKASSSWIPFPSSLVSPAAVGLAGSQNSQVLCSLNVWMALSRWPCMERTSAFGWHSFPLVIRFWFAPCHCFQRLRNVSNILKDQ